MTQLFLTRRAVLSALLASAALGGAASAQAADQPVRMIVPLAAGSTVDAIARALGPGLTRATGNTLIVENLAGAGGVPGTTQLVKAAPDGRTLGMISSNHVINPGIYNNIPYDSLKDITPVAVVATVPMLLVVNPKVPASDVQALIAYAKANPGKLNYGSAGNGSVLHLAMELLMRETGVKLQHVPYRGTAQLVTDLIGGQVDVGFVSISQVAPQVKSGALRALAVSTAMPSDAMPEVPYMAQAGVPGYAFDAWIALIGPAGLAKDVTARYADAVRQALASPEANTAIRGQGLTERYIGPDEAPAFFAAELAKHQKLIVQSGAKVD